MIINSISLPLNRSIDVQLESVAPIAKANKANDESQANVDVSSALDDTQKNTPDFTISKRLGSGGSIQTPEDQEERRAGVIRMLNIFIRELPKASKELSTGLETTKKVIADEVPSSIYKAWDFSIDENGSAVVVGDTLRADEKEKIADIIDSSGMSDGLSKTRDLMIQGLQEDRGKAMYSTTIGKYDLNEQNFSNIVFFKEYLSNIHEGQAGESLAAQLSSRAEEVYNKKNPMIDAYV